jgi:hypothetical protein
MTRCWTEPELRAALDRYETELREAGKKRNTINTYVQHPERFINWLCRNSGGEQETHAMATVIAPTSTRGSRYDPLRAHLRDRGEPVVRMTFAEIERLLASGLPASARRYPAWWANEESGTHVHARAWLDAGRRTAHVNLRSETVEFIS